MILFGFFLLAFSSQNDMDASCAYGSRSPCLRDRSCYWLDNECREVVKNIWYDREGQQTGGKDKILHIYGATDESKPVLMVNHGINGEAENLRSTALRFVQQGYLVVAPTLGTFNAIKRAFSWIKNNVEDYGGDMNRFSCHGYSAGGFRCTDLAFDETKNGNSDWFKAVVVNAGAPRNICGGAHENVPPFLFVHNENDPTVSIDNVHICLERFERAGALNQPETAIFETGGHSMSGAEQKAAGEEFLRRHNFPPFETDVTAETDAPKTFVWNLLTSTADGSNGCAGRGQIAAQGGQTLEQCKAFCEGEGAVFLQSHEHGWCSCFSECALTRPASDYNSAADVYELLQDSASEEEEITQDDEVTQNEFFLVDYNAHTEGNMMRIYPGSGSQEVKPALLVLPRKNNFDDMCGILANEGFLVMCPQWSRYNDIRRGLSWARNNLRAFNGDKDRFGLLSIEDATEHAIREVYRLSPDIFKTLVIQKGLKDSSIDRVQKTIGSTLIVGTQHSRYFAFKQALEDQNTDVELLLENDLNAEELENEIKSFFQNGL